VLIEGFREQAYEIEARVWTWVRIFGLIVHRTSSSTDGWRYDRRAFRVFEGNI
jgi:hypothetical protein